MMREYYRLIKPGIVYGNAIPAIAAFLFASHREGSVPLFFAMIIGLAFVIAASCVANNIMDRGIDARMARTKDRPLVSGAISVRGASIYLVALYLIGFTLLFAFTTLAATLAALAGAIVYVAFYTPAKHRTLHSTAIGAIAGATPPVVGYAAVTGMFDATALGLFLFLFAWQMVHFFAIGIYRKDEYEAAEVPIMPVVIGILPTKAAIITYTFVLAFSVYALYLAAGLGIAYAVVMGILSVGWIGFALIGIRTNDTMKWARGMFLYSLITLLAFSVVLSLS